MRVLATIAENELTKHMRDFEEHIECAYGAAERIALFASAGEGKVSLEQVMETGQGAFKVAFTFNMADEREMRKEVLEKSRELKKAVQDYEKILIKGMTLALDAAYIVQAR